MATVFLRTIIIYLLLLASIRLMGKRQVGELEVSELVITFLLSELAVLPISNKNAPLSHAVVPVLLLLSAEVIFSFILSKSERFRKFAIGKPSIIIKKGEVDRKELSKLRIGISELLSELRLKGAASISEVYYAIVEENGQLSVFKNAASSSLTPSDIGAAPKESGIAHCVIANGSVSDEGLRTAGKDRAWLKNKLETAGAAEDDVFLMTVDDSGDTIIIMKDTRRNGE